MASGIQREGGRMRGTVAGVAKGNVAGLPEGSSLGRGCARHARALKETPEEMDFSGNTSLRTDL